MGKKSRSAPGRRPILRLSPPGPRRDEAPGPPLEGADSGSEPEEAEAVPEPPRSAPNPPPPAPAAAVKPTGGLCLLGAYADSDEEEGESSEKPPRASGTNGTNSDIDSTLANFLAEIDAITAPPQPAEPSSSHNALPSSSSSSSSAPPPTPPRPEPKDSGVGSGSGSGSQPPSSTTNGAVPAAEWQYDTQCSLAGVGELEMGDWQEVWDENTGCYYYWNTQSNEVTWELPQYLATQVQGLQHYQHSSANGSFEPYSQEKGPGRGAKREVKKEVNEGVQALSNSEEEKKGVAAALLAPLLPEGVKEEEERWRRKVICKEEVVEPPPEEETKAGEVPVVAAGPQEAEAIREPLEEPLQEELCSVVQSGESGEEEEEQDTLELEMVLERKKAELRALEEGEGSISGSSPLSDGSQGAPQDPARRLASKRGKWKLFVAAASPETATRGSKTGRESPEVGETATNVETTEANPEKETEPEEPQEKPKPQGAPKLEEEEQDLKFQIGELANTLTSKLEFLGINRQSISNFHLLLLQTETRIADWREGALNGNYLKRKLQDAAEQLKQYEINATPKGWSCHWDREHRRYFYVNERSGESQWEFPDGEDEEEGERNAERKNEGPPQPPPKEKGERPGDTTQRPAGTAWGGLALKWGHNNTKMGSKQ
ncbi:formin-binding protein 4 [Phaethornis superciliosus]